MQEGDNIVTYYLRSNKDDNTRKAIDINPKSIVVKKDSVPPVITTLSANAGTDVTGEASITSSELGTYYYIVVSENYFDNKGEEEQAKTGMTADEVRKKAESNEGITGSGRIDKEKQINIDIHDLKPETTYVMYALLVDRAGNASDVKQVVFTTLSYVAPAAFKISPTFFIDCSACCVMPSASTVPVAGLMGICPDANTNEPVSMAWL